MIRRGGRPAGPRERNGFPLRFSHESFPAQLISKEAVWYALH